MVEGKKCTDIKLQIKPYVGIDVEKGKGWISKNILPLKHTLIFLLKQINKLNI